jgi:cytochrome b561
MTMCIISILFFVIGMISALTPKYLTLIDIHKALGIAILGLALVRLTLRMVYGAPALPPDLPLADRLAAISSEYVFYALMIGMPLIGWGMLSASSHPVILFGSAHLPPLLPVNPHMYTFLRRAHYILALAFSVLILVHFSAMIFHKMVKNDGIFETMAPELGALQTEDSAHGNR